MAEPASTHMTAEIGEAPEAVRRQETSLAGPLNELLLRLKAKPPRVVVTAAPELGLRRQPPESIVRERCVLYAKKYLGRELGKLTDQKAPR